MRLKHNEDAICPSCTYKLQSAHPKLISWFNELKKKYPHIHVSWAFRTSADQEACFKDGKTDLHYPHSKHNNLSKGLPCSLALDLFTIDQDGAARFPPMLYAKINEDNELAKNCIHWGGTWKHRADGDHFEINA